MGIVYVEYPEVDDPERNVQSNTEYRCKSCANVVARRSSIISMRFIGASGRAYLFDSCINVTHGPVYRRQLLTGCHHLRDVMCKRCKTVLGWYYEFASPQCRGHCSSPLGGAALPSDMRSTAVSVDDSQWAEWQARCNLPVLEENIDMFFARSRAALINQISSQVSPSNDSEATNSSVNRHDARQAHDRHVCQFSRNQRFKEAKSVLERHYLVEVESNVQPMRVVHRPRKPRDLQAEALEGFDRCELAEGDAVLAEERRIREWAAIRRNRRRQEFLVRYSC